MSMTDPIADMLTRIRNAVRVRHRSVDVPSSKVKAGVLDVLKREGYIAEYKIAEGPKTNLIRIYLKYNKVGESVIKEIRRESKPGLHRYLKVSALEPVLRGIGIAVISTSRGMMSDRECRKEHIGGEIVCTVW